MKIEELENKFVKIGKTSITVKDEEGKTRGVVRNITKYKDLPPNRQITYSKLLKQTNAWGNHVFDLNEIIIFDNTMYVLKNMKSKLFHDKYGFYSEEEKLNYDKREMVYQALSDKGITIVPVVFV